MVDRNVDTKLAFDLVDLHYLLGDVQGISNQWNDLTVLC